jgi:hypothetical protein
MRNPGALIMILALLAATSYYPVSAVPPPEAAFVDVRGGVWSWVDDGSAKGTWSQVPGVSGAAAVAILDGEVLIARLNGQVARWQGPGSRLAALPGLSDVRQLSCGPAHCLALTAWGRVFAWGAGEAGQIGNGNYEYQAIPILVQGLPEIAGIAAGTDHSLAVADDRRVYAWGGNIRNQLGFEAPDGTNVPRVVEGIHSGRVIAAGDGTSFVVLEDGRLLAWGAGDLGQLGLGVGEDVALPTEVPGIRAAEVATRGAESYVTLPNGSVRVFGRDPSSIGLATREFSRVSSHASTVAAMESDGSVTILREETPLSF